MEKLEKLVDAYNLGTLDVEVFFEALKKLIAEMEEEERRAAREELTEEELAIFDLLTKPEPKLTKAQEAEVKKVARDLLMKLGDFSMSSTGGRDSKRAPQCRARSGLPSTSCPRPHIHRRYGSRRWTPLGLHLWPLRARGSASGQARLRSISRDRLPGFQRAKPMAGKGTPRHLSRRHIVLIAASCWRAKAPCT